MEEQKPKKRVKKRRRKVSPAKRIAIIAGAIIGVFLLIGAGMAYYLYNQVDTTVDRLNESAGLSPDRMNQQTISDKKPVSVLLLGVDRRADEQGRSDSIIVMTLNPNSDESAMLSIPRDTKTEIVGKGTMDKINHAYSYGGIDTTIATVENLFDIPIDYYATINFDGIEDLVDAVGGVEVDVLIPISGRATGNVELEPGVQTLNGQEALAYARMRKDDPEGDVGRAKRQQQVLEAIINEATTINSFAKLNRIMNAVGNNIRTNMTLAEASQLQSYTKSLRSFNQETLKGGDLTIGGVYYYEIDEADLEDKQALLKTELGLPVTAETDTQEESDDNLSETTTY